MKTTAEKVKEYRIINKCSIFDAKKAVYRKEFCKELRSDETIESLAGTLIRILDFEFGGYE
jgi:hypothetical protein